MIYLVAIHAGEIEPRMCGGAGLRGELLRAGAAPDDDLFLPGVDSLDAEFVSDGSSWFVRFPDGSIDAARTGSRIDFGSWTVFVLVSRAGPEADVESARPPSIGESLALLSTIEDLPRFTAAGQRPVVLVERAPMLLGSHSWCGLRLRSLLEPIVGIVWRNPDTGITTFVPVRPGMVRIDDRSVDDAVTLADGAVLFVEPTQVSIAYHDPQEELERILGLSSQARPATEMPSPAVQAPDGAKETPLARRLADAVAATPHAWISPVELCLGLTALLVFCAYALLVWTRY